MWGVAAVAVVTGLIQAYQSEKARGANSAKLKEIERMFAQIVPPEYDISINTPPQYVTEKLQGANLDLSSITPEQFKVMGTYAPEAAQYVAEANPQLVQQTATGQEGRQSQIDSLREFKKLMSGENPELKARMQEAANASQSQAQSREQSLLQDSQRRGTLGSGVSFAAMLQGNSDSMLGGAQAGRDAAVEAYRAKLQGTQQAGTMGRQLAQDELGQQQTNADIINQFNQRTSRNYQEYLNNRQQLANQAQMFNLQNAQDIGNKNVAQGNEFAVMNQKNKNALGQQQYENARGERNYADSQAEKLAQWAAQEKARQNDLKTQTYQNSIAKANGMAGLGGQQMQQTTQNAQDRNAIIGAVGSTVAGGYANQQQTDANKANWDSYLKARYSTGNTGNSAGMWDDEMRNKYSGIS